MITPKRFDIFPPDWGMLRRRSMPDAFRFFFEPNNFVSHISLTISINGAPFSYRNRTPHLYEIFLLRFVKCLLRAYKYRQLRP